MRVDLWLNIVLIAGPLVLGTYLSTVKGIPRRTKKIAWVVCLLICLGAVYGVIRERKGQEQKVRVEEYYHQLHERQELYSRGLPRDYVGGLGKNPLLKHSFNMGQKYEREFKFKEAIKELKECLSHPNATEENKVAANILVGNCYYMLCRLKEAEKHYKEALNISERVKDKAERLRGRSAALGNLGLIYSDLGRPDEALKYHREALEIDREIGYQQGIASDLGNIGVIYRGLGKSEEALKHHKDALEIFKRIGAQREIEIALENIRDIEEEKRREQK